MIESYGCPIQLTRKTKGRKECEGEFTISGLKEHMNKCHKPFMRWVKKWFRETK